MIEANILLDSINTSGNRLTTWVLTYPRFIHAEIMTHRMFSRNASSSRAIPVKKMLEDVKNNPAMPVYWGKNQAGMQAAEELDDSVPMTYWTSDSERIANPTVLSTTLTLRGAAKKEWLEARDNAVKYVETMSALGLHKQIANRLLEPWMHITVILTASEYGNFFSLRAHKDAQPEFQALAYMMLEKYNTSTPKELAVGEWHIPFGDKIDEVKLINDSLVKTHGDKWWLNLDGDVVVQSAKLKIATARCARVSYLNFEGKDDYNSDIELADRLAASGHWSPFEHVAKAQWHSGQSGNFKGWEQYRKTFIGENRSDKRILQK
jgi:thymidylate synthase ThyX